MVWAYSYASEENENALGSAIAEIDKSPDRSAAIVAAAFVDDYLARALKRRMHQDEKAINEMFGSSGPLGSFSSKIRLALLTGLCSNAACKDLDIVRAIRNEFAHSVLTMDFQSQRVKDLSANLSFTQNVKMTITPEGKPSAKMEMFSETPKTPRERYLRACQVFLLIFSMSKDDNFKPPEPLF